MQNIIFYFTRVLIAETFVFNNKYFFPLAKVLKKERRKQYSILTLRAKQTHIQLRPIFFPTVRITLIRDSMRTNFDIRNFFRNPVRRNISTKLYTTFRYRV